MRRVTILAVVLFGIGWLAGPAAATGAFQWSVQSTRIKSGWMDNGRAVEGFRSEYYLYYGNRETLEEERTRNAEHVFSCLYLLHPDPQVSVPFPAPHRWYAGTRRARYLSPETRALFDEDVWQAIPEEIKAVLEAFGIDDPDLLLIWYDTHTRSVQVFFHPRYNEDRGFYLRQLDIVRQYFAHPRLPA
jgi:hypothetical protein